MTEDQFGPDTAIDDHWEEAFADVGHFETGAIPVEAVLRRGKGIRGRRRMAGGSALAVAAALAIGLPAALAGHSGTGNGAESGGDRIYGATNSGGRVTVNPTPFSKGTGHFSGTIDGKPWKVDFDNKNCFSILWSCGFKGPYPWDKYGSLAVDASADEPFNYTLFLSKDVGQAKISLSDGEVLRLDAVPVFDTPVVLFSLPDKIMITRIDLFDVYGTELAFTLPFAAGEPWNVNGAWYRPDEKPPTTTTAMVELARGEIAGEQEIIDAFVGPSGVCFATRHSPGADDPTCDSLVPSTATETFSPPPPGSHSSSSGGRSSVGLAAPEVDHIELTFADGTTSPVPIKSLGGHRFFAYIIPSGKVLTAVTGYNAAGKPLPAVKHSW